MNSKYTFRALRIELERQPDSKKYPNQVKESYELSDSLELRYSAYFGGVPIDMNHNDDARWSTGAHGEKVLAAVAAIISDGTKFSALVPIPDEGENPCSSDDYAIGLTGDEGDVSFCARKGSAPYASINAAFSELVSAFETATGRPLTPLTLPQ